MREAHTGGYHCHIYIHGHAALPSQKSTPKAGAPNRFFGRFLAPLQHVVITQVRPPPTSHWPDPQSWPAGLLSPGKASPDGAFVSTGTSLREPAVLPNRRVMASGKDTVLGVTGTGSALCEGTPSHGPEGSLGRGQAGQNQRPAEPGEARAAAAPGPLRTVVQTLSSSQGAWSAAASLSLP